MRGRASSAGCARSPRRGAPLARLAELCADDGEGRAAALRRRRRRRHRPVRRRRRRRWRRRHRRRRRRRRWRSRRRAPCDVPGGYGAPPPYWDASTAASRVAVDGRDQRLVALPPSSAARAEVRATRRSAAPTTPCCSLRSSPRAVSSTCGAPSATRCAAASRRRRPSRAAPPRTAPPRAGCGTAHRSRPSTRSSRRASCATTARSQRTAKARTSRETPSIRSNPSTPRPTTTARSICSSRACASASPASVGVAWTGPRPSRPLELHDSMVDDLGNPRIFVLSRGLDNQAFAEFVVSSAQRTLNRTAAITPFSFTGARFTRCHARRRSPPAWRPLCLWLCLWLRLCLWRAGRGAAAASGRAARRRRGRGRPPAADASDTDAAYPTRHEFGGGEMHPGTACRPARARPRPLRISPPAARLE